MRHKSNKPWRKRKHRNGKRPQLKGSIKINLQELPTYAEPMNVYALYLKMEGQHLRGLPNFPYLGTDCGFDLNLWNRRFADYKQKQDLWEKERKRQHEVRMGLLRSVRFLQGQSAVDTRDLSLDAINEVQPEAPIKFYIEPFCNSCKRKNRCPLMKLEWLERSETCKKLITAYDGFCNELDNGTFERPMDYSVNYQRSLSEAWEIQLS